MDAAEGRILKFGADLGLRWRCDGFVPLRGDDVGP